MTTQNTLSTWLIDAYGQPYTLTGPGAATSAPSLKAMAHACAQISRFNGHCRRPYSVAEHQMLCAGIAREMGLSPIVQLACLSHDLHEAYVGDVTSPVKWALGATWENFEHPHVQRVRQYLGLSEVFATHRADIKRIDLIALATERRDLLPWDAATSDPWPILDTPGEKVEPFPRVNLNTHTRLLAPWQYWKSGWLQHNQTLRAEIARSGDLSHVDPLSDLDC